MLNGTVTIPIESNAPPAGFYPTEKINGIYDLCRQLVATNTLDVLLDSIVRQVIQILHAKFSRIMTLEADGTFTCQASFSLETLDLMFSKGCKALPHAQTLYQHVVLNEAPVVIEQGRNLSADLRLALKLSYHDSLFLVPLRVNQETVGLLAFGEEHRPVPEAALREKLRLAVLIADQAASAIYRARLSYRLEESQLQTVLALAKVMDSRDAYVGNHSRKVTAVAVRLARKLDCPPAEVQAIRWAALLHDIGKVGIPDDILNKRSSLSDEEWKAMREHPQKGAEIVRVGSNLDYVAGLIQAHHERYDGSGYPNKLQREMIPFGARILAVADAYSAMTDDRPYRASSTLEQTIDEMRRCAGTQFDPVVVEAFIALYS